MSEPITVEQAQARGLHLVCTTPGQVRVGDIIEHVATGKQLRIVKVVNERQALAKLLRFKRTAPATPRRRTNADNPLLMAAPGAVQ